MSTRAYQRRSRAISTTSMLAIGLGLVTVSGAQAQNTPGAAVSPDDNTVSEVVVVGARASQQSAIDRKRRARTATDSIVADDVGSFPDRNLNEAISRVAGTALERNEFGEGSSVSIRGNGPNFTRVEIDGMGVAPGGQGLALGQDDTRGADMRELPADLIKSVDIVKGSTADMTEGSLGGGVQITTRSGLDFKKPYLSLRLGATQNDLDEEYRPDVNLVASTKFLDGRLGVIGSVSYSKMMMSGHRQEVVTSQTAGYSRFADFDNSAEKTFTYDPNALRGDIADVVMANSTLTPRDVARLSAQATSKTDCLTLFPTIRSPTQVESGAGNFSTALTNQINQRANEQLSCLNQWNDYTPSNLRSFMNTNDDERLSTDVRFDYRVSDKLTVFAKFLMANRRVGDIQLSRSLGNIGTNPTTFPPSYIDSIASNPAFLNAALPFSATNCVGAVNGVPASNGYPAIPARAGCANSNDTVYRRGVNSQGYWTYNGAQPTGTIGIDLRPGNGTTNVTLPLYGIAVNVDPASVKVDANHHVTEFVYSNGATNIDQISNVADTKTRYVQGGGEYNDGPLRVEFMASMQKLEYSRLDLRSSRAYQYGYVDANGVLQGNAKLTVQPSGLWSYTLPEDYDELDPANYAVVAARLGNLNANATYPQYSSPPSYFNSAGIGVYTQAQRPLTTPNYQITFSPRVSESEEKQAKLDLTYDLSDRSDVFTRFKAGFQYRNFTNSAWGGGDTVLRDALGTYDPTVSPAENVRRGYQAAIILPGTQQRGQFRACVEATNTDGTPVVGRQSCNYGYQTGTFASNGEFTPNSSVFQGLHTFTPAELTALFADTVLPPTATFFDGYPGSSGTETWGGIDVVKLFAATGAADTLDLDCIKVCTASDGQVYAQPVAGSDERVVASYAMLDFDHELPFALNFSGNIGVRGVHRTNNGGGLFTYTSIFLNNPGDPTSTATTTYNVRQQKVIKDSTFDVLPSFNGALSAFDDALVGRYYIGRVITPPNIRSLLPTGQCTVDERRGLVQELDGDTEDQNCSRIGNPELKPYEAVNQNIALEWYPNRDTMFSVTWHQQDVKVGGAIPVTRNDVRFFEGSTETDPRTGRPLSEIEFTVPTWENGPGFKRSGLEYSAKTAFTFLPWFLRHTGADWNYATLASAGSTTFIDPLTGEGQKPQNESDYFQNLSVWYDDGRINARVSYQTRGETFLNVSAAGANTVNNVPTGNPGARENVLPYNPGEPYFTSETAYLDAKVTYKFRPDLEFYLEGRNLRQEAQTRTGSDRTGFADGQQNLYSIAYGGRRFMFGLVYRYGAK